VVAAGATPTAPAYPIILQDRGIREAGVEHTTATLSPPVPRLLRHHLNLHRGGSQNGTLLPSRSRILGTYACQLNPSHFKPDRGIREPVSKITPSGDAGAKAVRAFHSSCRKRRLRNLPAQRANSASNHADQRPALDAGKKHTLPRRNPRSLRIHLARRRRCTAPRATRPRLILNSCTSTPRNRSRQLPSRPRNHSSYATSSDSGGPQRA